MARAIRSLSDRLADVVLWGDKLANYVAGSTFETFADDDMAVDAATKCIEVIGDASKHILQQAPDLLRCYPTLKLYHAYETRNRLSHGYFHIDKKRIWETANYAVPEFVAAIREVIRDRQRDAGS